MLFYIIKFLLVSLFNFANILHNTIFCLICILEAKHFYGLKNLTLSIFRNLKPGCEAFSPIISFERKVYKKSKFK